MYKLVFLHIPKTAGSTMRSILEAQYPPHKRYLISSGNTLPPAYQYEVARNTLLGISKFLYPKIDLIYGHMPYDSSYFDSGKVKFAAFMREPISRVISSYNYILTTPGHPLHLFVQNKSIIEYAGNDSLQLDNLQLRILSGITDRNLTNDDLEHTKNLIRSDYVFLGITEEFEKSIALLKDTLGWPIMPDINTKNITKSKGKVREEDIETLKEIYKYDIELYNFALERFDVSVNKIEDHFQKELFNLQANMVEPKDKIVKKIHPIRSIAQKFGFDIIRYNPKTLKGSSNKKLPYATSVHSEELKLFKTATGNYFLPAKAHKDIIANAIITDQVFEKEVVELAKSYIKPGTAVLDVGSNFGQMAVLFGGEVGKKGKVYCFDADDFIFSILKKNIEANNLQNTVIPNFGAVHNVEGETLIFPEHDLSRWGTYGAYGIDYNAKEGRQVKTITIDGLNIKEPISFMKVDVQGGDLQAMQGAKQTILKNQMPILFEYEYHLEEEFNLCFQDYVDFVQEIGYEFIKVISGHNFLIVPKKQNNV